MGDYILEQPAMRLDQVNWPSLLLLRVISSLQATPSGWKTH
ncbi:MAG: hypothetical protein WC803_00970 [Sphingomonas sp.]|jgi:hypothetical protein